MIEQRALTLFLYSTVITAVSVIVLMWFSNGNSEPLFKLAASTFIIGLASFIVCFTRVGYRLATHIAKKP